MASVHSCFRHMIRTQPPHTNPNHFASVYMFEWRQVHPKPNSWECKSSVKASLHVSIFLFCDWTIWSITVVLYIILILTALKSTPPTVSLLFLFMLCRLTEQFLWDSHFLPTVTVGVLVGATLYIINLSPLVSSILAFGQVLLCQAVVDHFLKPKHTAETWKTGLYVQTLDSLSTLDIGLLVSGLHWIREQTTL